MNNAPDSGESPKRRVTDHQSKDWPKGMISDGIENRLLFAAPGTTITLRPGTTDLAYDEVRRITWGDVIGILCGEGVMEEGESDTWKKKVLAFGIDEDGSDRIGVDGLVNSHDVHMLAQLDIENPAQRRILVRLHLEREIRESAIMHGTHDFSDLIEPLTDAAIEAMAEIGKGRSMEAHPNWLKLRDGFISVLEGHGINLQDDDGWVTYKGERKRIFSGRMINSWASRVCNVYKLPVF